jgi:hypothetical protein
MSYSTHWAWSIALPSSSIAYCNADLPSLSLSLTQPTVQVNVKWNFNWSKTDGMGQSRGLHGNAWAFTNTYCSVFVCQWYTRVALPWDYSPLRYPITFLVARLFLLNALPTVDVQETLSYCAELNIPSRSYEVSWTVYCKEIRGLFNDAVTIVKVESD